MNEFLSFKSHLVKQERIVPLGDFIAALSSFQAS